MKSLLVQKKKMQVINIIKEIIPEQNPMKKIL